MAISFAGGWVLGNAVDGVVLILIVVHRLMEVLGATLQFHDNQTQSARVLASLLLKQAREDFSNDTPEPLNE